jgi:hypothetical protein
MVGEFIRLPRSRRLVGLRRPQPFPSHRSAGNAIRSRRLRLRRTTSKGRRSRWFGLASPIHPLTRFLPSDPLFHKGVVRAQ